MKCPKCGYLGFETTDRCRNCQYDFSLTPFASEPDLTLQPADRDDLQPDLDLPVIRRTDSHGSPGLDLDRLFGESEGEAATSRNDPPNVPLYKYQAEAEAEAARQAAAELLTRTATPAAGPASPAASDPGDGSTPPGLELVKPPARLEAVDAIEPATSVEGDELTESAAQGGPEEALPFDDAPIVPPPAARPLAVRRATPEVPRNRPRTTRVSKPTPLALEPEAAPAVRASSRTASAETAASLTEVSPLGARVGAGLIDTALLIAIDVAVLYLTLRISDLRNSIDDLRVLPAVPLAGFLGLLAFGYVAAFTVACGQTIGKMIMSLRVIGDDGRPIDAAGGMLRAAGCMLVPLTLGLSYVPALVTSDHRALHDRLAGTRVVRE